MSVHEYDAIIIGAGISGISAAYHFQKQFPEKTYIILERRNQLGGTWDLFNYPGIRSDSDMYTFGFSFHPWKETSAIAEKSQILDYLNDTVQTFGIDQHIEYGQHIKQAHWHCEEAYWQIESDQSDHIRHYRAQYVFMCVGYYNYDQAHCPDFKGVENYQGQLIHSQFWPKELDYDGKRVLTIGNGATAITLLPSMAENASHVTMLQRSPTFIQDRAKESKIAVTLSKWLGHWAARWWFILMTMWLYVFCRLFPNYSKELMIRKVEKQLKKPLMRNTLPRPINLGTNAFVCAQTVIFLMLLNKTKQQ